MRKPFKAMPLAAVKEKVWQSVPEASLQKI